MQKWLVLLIVLIFTAACSYGQSPKVDSASYFVSEISSNYFSSIDKKTSQYKNRLSSKMIALKEMEDWQMSDLVMKKEPFKNKLVKTTQINCYTISYITFMCL